MGNTFADQRWFGSSQRSKWIVVVAGVPVHRPNRNAADCLVARGTHRLMRYPCRRLLAVLGGTGVMDLQLWTRQQPQTGYFAGFNGLASRKSRGMSSKLFQTIGWAGQSSVRG